MIKLLIAGDFCPRRRVEKLFAEKKYKEVLEEVLCFTKEADYSIVNLEAPVVIGDAKPIEKTGPNLKADIHAVEAIKYAGFDCVTLANNHFYDYGEQGVNDTLEECYNYGIDYVGGGRNINEASKTLYKNIKNKKFAFINFCEQEWSIATEYSSGSNPLNPVNNYYQIKDAKLNADYVIVIVHGGHEHYQLPSPRMKETYQFFVDVGADAVINHHQHCYSGYEIYNEKPIFYGLGNFCFDWDGKGGNLWEEGYMVMLCFGDTISYKIIPYRQCHAKPKVEIIDINEIKNNIENFNVIINDRHLLQKKYEENICSNIDLLEPFKNRYLLTLQRRKLFPSLLSKNYKKLLLNLVRCESHRDFITYNLNNDFNNNKIP